MQVESTHPTNEVALSRLTSSDLRKISIAFHIKASPTANKQELIYLILERVGEAPKRPRTHQRKASTNTPVAQPPKAPELTAEQLASLVAKYISDELSLLSATRSGLEGILAVLSVQPQPVSKTKLNRALEHALADLRYYTQHTNLRTLANTYRTLNPEKRLEL